MYDKSRFWQIFSYFRVDNVQAISMIQSALTAVRTPTLELITELITLVKTQLKPLAAERTILYNVAIVQTSNLIHKVKMTQIN